MKTKILIFALLVFAAAYERKPAAIHTRTALSASERAEESKGLRHAYLAISIANSAPETKRGLALLAAGLISGDEELRRRSAAHVENLLVKLAHGELEMDSENRQDVSALVSLYKIHAQDRLHRMETAAPESPTLAYIRNN